MLEELVLVHVLFRHGERTPETKYSFPGQSDYNNTFPPYGSGQLTNVGKRTMYKLGQILRSRYENFLSETYFPGIIEAQCTNSDRTKASLQLVLASLFEPKDDLVWNNNLNWQPIPFDANPRADDKILGGFFNPKFVDQFEGNLSGSLLETIEKKYNGFIQNLENKTKTKFTSTRLLWGLTANLEAEECCNLNSQEWTKTDLRTQLKSVVLIHYQIQTNTKKNRQFLTGDLLIKILEDTKRKAQGSSQVQIHLYSAHEMNLVSFLMVLSKWDEEIPPYGACLAAEIYKIGQDYVMRLAYQKKISTNFEYLEFSNGKIHLSLKEFEECVAELYLEE